MEHEEFFAEVFDENKHSRSSKSTRQEAYDDEEEGGGRTQTCVHQ